MDRRRFLRSLTAPAAGAAIWPLPSSAAFAIGPRSLLEIGMLRYDGNFDPRPTGVRRMLQEVEKRTSIAVETKPPGIDPADREHLFTTPMLFWAGDRAFSPLSVAARDNLATWLGAGGMIVVDSAEGQVDAPFITSVRRELAAIAPGKGLIDIPRSHVVYKSFYLIPDPVGRVSIARTMQGVFGPDRAMVLLSQNDLLGAWARDNLGNFEYDVFPGGDRQREMAYRLGVNLVMYALCLNYKEDQVHVPFILKRRKWKVD